MSDCRLCVAMQEEETVYRDDKITCLHNFHHDGLLWLPNEHIEHVPFILEPEYTDLRAYMQEWMHVVGDELFGRYCILYNWGTAITVDHGHYHQLPNFHYPKDMRVLRGTVQSL